jgi:hypothetical protein
MPDAFPPSEFGGKTNNRRVQPSIRPDGKRGHSPTVGERLGLYYRTGDESGESPEQTAFWEGLLPLAEQRKIRENAGDFDKGVDLP